jgi:hypothetical protein
MAVLGGGSVSYERGTPVGRARLDMTLEPLFRNGSNLMPRITACVTSNITHARPIGAFVHLIQRPGQFYRATTYFSYLIDTRCKERASDTSAKGVAWCLVRALPSMLHCMYRLASLTRNSTPH